MRTSRASRGAPTPAKPRKLYGKPVLVSSLSRLAGLLGGGGSPERTGLGPSMGLVPLVGRRRFAERTRGGAGGPEARVLSRPNVGGSSNFPRFWRGHPGVTAQQTVYHQEDNCTTMAPGVQQAGAREPGKDRPPIGPAILVRRAPTQGRTNPPKSPKAHACPGLVGMTQPEPGNCGSR